MVSIVELWLPVVLGAVFVFAASSVIHMCLPIHKKDFKKLPKEAEFMAATRALELAPGEYVFPCAGSMKEMGSPEMLEKYKQGPVGYMTLFPNAPVAMGKSLVQWFLYSVLVGILVGYAGSISLPAGSSFGDVFRTTGTVAVIAYGCGSIQNSIWKGVAWSTTAKFVLDGVVYGLVTGAAFAWLWPDATALAG